MPISLGRHTESRRASCRHRRSSRTNSAISTRRARSMGSVIMRRLGSFETSPASALQNVGRVAADTAYGSAENLVWLVYERGIEPHTPVFDKSQRATVRSHVTTLAIPQRDCYTCPGGKELGQRQKISRVARPFVDENGMLRYRASKLDCEECSLKPQCCPNAHGLQVLRSIPEGARDMARAIWATDAYVTSRRERKKVEMLFAHLKRILKLDRLRLRGPNGARDEFHLAATAQNLRKLAMLIPIQRRAQQPEAARPPSTHSRPPTPDYFKPDFFNGI
jgi:hypothetical protein